MLSKLLLLNFNFGTLKSLVLLELKKLFTYQLEFWISSLVYIPLQTFATFFIWKAALGDLSCFGEHCLNSGQVVIFFLVAGFISRVQLRSDDMTTMFLIYNGQISKLLCYPISYWHFTGAKALVNLLYQVVILTSILLIYNLVASDQRLMSFSLLALLQSLSLVVLAIIISKLGVTIINASAFWIDRCGPILFSYMRVQVLLGGSLVPVFMMPPEVASIVKLLPFYSMVEVPTLILLQGANYSLWLNAITILSSWLLFYLVACLMMWRSGLKNYSAVGI